MSQNDRDRGRLRMPYLKPGETLIVLGVIVLALAVALLWVIGNIAAMHAILHGGHTTLGAIAAWAGCVAVNAVVFVIIAAAGEW